MEGPNDQHPKKHGSIREFLHDAPKWFHTMWIILSVAFAAGGLWTRVSDNQQKLDGLKSLPARVTALETKSASDDSAREKQVTAENKLADSVNKLSVSVARLEGQLEEKDRLQK